MYFTIKSKVKIHYSCHILQYEICTNTGVYYMHTEVDKNYLKKTSVRPNLKAVTDHSSQAFISV